MVGITASGAAQSIFGSSNALTVFSIGATQGGATQEQLAAKTAVGAAEREINGIRGYKPRLSLAENQRLTKIQEKIQSLNQKARDGNILASEIEDREELYLEADTIIGKPSASVELDDDTEDELDIIREKIDDLLAPKLDRASANRLETLENLKVTIEEQLTDGTGGRTAQLRLQNVVAQINNLTPPRQLHQLSPSERAEYNELADEANDVSGVKLVLSARESDRVYNLETTIRDLQATLPADTSNQPTTADVARAYTRI